MLKLDIRNSLMIAVQDNEAAFVTAHAFVQDDYHKLMVFNRCLTVAKSEGDTIEVRANLAKEKADRLWILYEA